MKFTVKEICLTALFTALVFVMTFVPKIPIPLGYAHLGNAAVFLGVVLIGRRNGAIAGSIGSGLADLIGGFAIWIIPTLIIKYVMAMIFAYAGGQAQPGNFSINRQSIIGLVLACLWMTVSYTIAGAVLYGSLETCHGGRHERSGIPDTGKAFAENQAFKVNWDLGIFDSIYSTFCIFNILDLDREI